jgi:hypothetical protein
MQLVCITDLHGRLEALERILADAGHPDVALLGGDITNFGSPIDAARVIEAVQERVPTVLAVSGNCDSTAIDEELDRLGVALHGRGFLCGNIGIHGLSAIPPWKRGMYQLTEEELEAALERGYAAIQSAPRHVLLAHVPPRGMKVDRTFFFTHAGSTAVRSFVDRVQPCLVFCGHIHEGRGIDTSGRTTVVNCGFAGRGEYALAHVTDDDVHVDLRLAR